MTAYRLPLELEMHILELATPPLFMHCIRQRVHFLRRVSLVHRSFTTWAQDKLHEQFVFTLRGRPGEVERLEKRLGAAFGPHSPFDLTGLYLDLRAQKGRGRVALRFLNLSQPMYSDGYCHSMPIDPLLDFNEIGAEREFEPAAGVHGSHGQNRYAAVLLNFTLATQRLWILPPRTGSVATLSCPSLNVLEMDDSNYEFGCWEDVLRSQKLPNLTTVVLRGTDIDASAPLDALFLKNLIHYQSDSCVGLDKSCPSLEHYVSINSRPAPTVGLFTVVPSTLRTARCYIYDTDVTWDLDSHNLTAPVSLPSTLQSFKLICVASSSTLPSVRNIEHLPKLVTQIEAACARVNCDFEFKHTTDSPTRILEAELARFGI
ncbi:hypothetical protein JCM10908_006772 [Rhodotorula pacifica]|uniref:uncharacterized protein n=1 Tax=Rhodotorula pacifica TaxID=1495444 RepID=UPI0031749FBA